MCGFVGFFHCGNPEELRSAVKAIIHRGPDGEGLQWFPQQDSGIAHRRLSIIDLSDRAAQPMHDPRTGNWIVFNGEVYNYLKLRHELESKGYNFFSDSDTEVVLKAYHCWGVSCLDKLNGMFAFVIFNEQSGDVFGARDRLGIKPFYYHHSLEKLAVASEIKSILECRTYSREPDYQAILTPVHFQAGPYTGFKDILKLPAGHYLEFRKGRLIIQQWWKIKPEEKPIIELEAVGKLDELLRDAVKMQMVADVPVGLLLSGGLDSSLIGALMNRITSEPIHSFTIKFPEADQVRHGNVNDSVYAQKIAAKEGFLHSELTIKPDVINLLPNLIHHLDEPLADPSVINTYLICQAARERGIIVLQTGMGADEVFGGYRSYLACLKGDTYTRFPSFVRKGMESMVKMVPQSTGGHSMRKLRYLKKFFHFAGLPPFERYLAALNTALTAKDFQEYYLQSQSFEDTIFYQRQFVLYNDNDCSYLTKMCLNDTRIYLPDHNLAYSDRGSMAVGVELRPPLIDHDIVEYMFSLPAHFRIRGNIQKYLLKKVAEKYLPPEIINRPKAPFSAPMRSWLKKDLREMVDDLLSENTVKKRGIYNPKYVRKLLHEDRSGLEDHSQLIFRLMVNELWFRIFFDGKQSVQSA